MSERLDLLPWRTGRKVGRNLYAQVDDEPGVRDVDIGRMDTTELAVAVVEAHNASLTDEHRNCVKGHHVLAWGTDRCIVCSAVIVVD